MSDRMYDIVKNLALILAPTCTLIMALLQAFDILDNETGIAVASAIDTFLGAIVVVAKQIYDSKNGNKVENLESNTKEEG